MTASFPSIAFLARTYPAYMGAASAEIRDRRANRCLAAAIADRQPEYTSATAHEANSMLHNFVALLDAGAKLPAWYTYGPKAAKPAKKAAKKAATKPAVNAAAFERERKAQVARTTRKAASAITTQYITKAELTAILHTLLRSR